MKRTYLFYKPFNVISQFTREVAGQQCLADFIKNVPKDVYPVGRLDYDSEGLLLLTNDKSLNKKLLSSMFDKKYYVQVEGEINQEAIYQLTCGVEIKLPNKSIYKTKPCEVSIIDEPILPDRIPPIRYRLNQPTSWLKINLHEGKNRQIRKMCAKVGYPVLRLVRYSFSNYRLDNMQVGDLREIEN
jgi:23S rRNA pseudouridine2457 synthase